MGIANTNEDANASRILDVQEVIFDFEGTLVDFQWQLDPAVQECFSALEDAGFKRQWYGEHPTYATIYNHTLSLSSEGKGGSDPHLAMATIDAIYDKYDADAMRRWNPYADTLDTLATLKKSGFQLGLVSNVGRNALIPTLDRLGISRFLAVVVSRNDVDRLKPSPDGLLKAADKLCAEPNDVILIGDSRDDVGAARSAGMLAGYLTGGQHSPEEMSGHEADIEIIRLGQLPKRLNRVSPSTES